MFGGSDGPMFDCEADYSSHCGLTVNQGLIFLTNELRLNRSSLVVSLFLFVDAQHLEWYNAVVDEGVAHQEEAAFTATVAELFTCMNTDDCALHGQGAVGDGIRSLDTEDLSELDELGLAALVPTDQLFQDQHQDESVALDPSRGVRDRISAATTSGRSSRPDGNVTRRRQKEELRYLRERAAELEQELALLRAKRLGDTIDAVDAIAAPSPWERIAARQREARRNAEKENERLRCDVEAQLRLARNLERLLRKRPSLGASRTSLMAGTIDAGAYMTRC